MDQNILANAEKFAEVLFERLSQLNAGIQEVEMYEFRYALGLITPPAGWQDVTVEPTEVLQNRVQQETFLTGVQFKPRKDGKTILDASIQQLTNELFVGLVREAYSVEWVDSLFYFDIRAFCFFLRTQYFNPTILENFASQPHAQFEKKQQQLEKFQDLGYQEFSWASKEVDSAFLKILQIIIKIKKKPLLLTLVGPTGAGKTEIIDSIQTMLVEQDISVNTIGLDNFYKDGSFREGKPFSKELIHYEMLIDCLKHIRNRQPATIPQYNFINLTSSHDLNSQLRKGNVAQNIQPADVIFIEGNYPFHQPDVAPLVDIKVVYLTDDPVRLKRKWRRDIDYRKKYEPVYFVNRYFRTQQLRANEIYQPLLAQCDIAVDTTNAAIWLTPTLQNLIFSGEKPAKE